MLVFILIQIEFNDRFSKNIQISNLMKIRPVEAQLFHADRQKDRRTDLRKLILKFCEGV